ncbi:hypothetical protein ARA02_04925 [Leuconostoc mesenteroides subsp. jonggajibkimchii]|uniref:hypothetical protein n=1 Tax=Leuconostoc mesenteroides TaxID=1245 RepID=UPI0009039C9A|nr:hypothetical protein [Leuconostoc mesenteroides]APE76702.1 hypothetical protein ARA02_04925 [Leuconostoc mesenteroides subsp. jonggajibkimchii]
MGVCHPRSGQKSLADAEFNEHLKEELDDFLDQVFILSDKYSLMGDDFILQSETKKKNFIKTNQSEYNNDVNDDSGM